MSRPELFAFAKPAAELGEAIGNAWRRAYDAYLANQRQKAVRERMLAAPHEVAMADLEVETSKLHLTETEVHDSYFALLDQYQKAQDALTE